MIRHSTASLIPSHTMSDVADILGLDVPVNMGAMQPPLPGALNAKKRKASETPEAQQAKKKARGKRHHILTLPLP